MDSKTKTDLDGKKPVGILLIMVDKVLMKRILLNL